MPYPLVGYQRGQRQEKAALGTCSPRCSAHGRFSQSSELSVDSYLKILPLTIYQYDKIVHEEGILNDGRFVLSRLRDLAKRDGVFPRYYTLSGIQSDFQTIHGGAFADLCQGEYKSQKLGLKMIRIFGDQDKRDIIKVRR